MQLQIEGTLTEKDNHQHIRHVFEVPEGATRLDLDFEYAPKRTAKYGNLLTLSLFDPNGERGSGHRGQPKQHVTLSRGEATPGYFPGPLLPGTWTVMINCNLINAGPPINYHFDIAFGFDPQPEFTPWPPRGKTRPRGTGWYRGDLHGHTVHSDGSWECAGLLDFARQHKLDFVTLTDHNTISALPQMDSLSSDELLTLCGFELTTFYGHALALGVRQYIDWRVRPGERSMTDIMKEILSAGGTFVIAHPLTPGDPICTGCHWEYEDLMPGAAGLVEVCNEQWDSTSNNEQAVQLWYKWLNQGHRIFATVGTDIHGPPDPAIEFLFDVVYAQELSEAAILDAVRNGHLYLSAGPQVEFSGKSASGSTAGMGDTLNGTGREVTACWQGCQAEDRLRLVVDGQVKEELPASSDSEKTWRFEDGQKHWCVIEVRDSKGYMRALTNPIFIG